ncbi:MAG: chorismate synthase [Deltaproteobacteria bacterium]|nr:chorismate synthase [Deltaproteobacteria bacterium]
MAGNTFGTLFRVTTFGESHGSGIGAVIDGCPSGINLVPDDFEKEMARRKPGRSSYDTPRREDDMVEILSGIFEGKTTGAPIALFIRNNDIKSRPYGVIKSLFRPGHGDYAYFKKYGHFDFRGAGRYSARETAARVAAGVVAGSVIQEEGISVRAYTMELGGVRATRYDTSHIDESPFYCPDPDATRQIEKRLADVREQGDSLGGIVEIKVNNCPAGLGEPVFDKLDADLAKAVMSIGAVKGVEIGAGFEAARLKGSENNDPIIPGGFRTNRAGGILGGISNGDEIIIRAAIKPIPSIRKEQETIDRDGKPATIRMEGRYDISAIPRIVPVLEAMVKIVLADHYLRFKAFSREGGASNRE